MSISTIIVIDEFAVSQLVAQPIFILFELIVTSLFY